MTTLQSLNKKIPPAKLAAANAVSWLLFHKIHIDLEQPVDFSTHPYEILPLMEEAKVQVVKKAAQLGFTTVGALKSIYGMINGRYPQGVLYLFPSRTDVSDFSVARFKPLINYNPVIAAAVRDTDRTHVKKIGPSTLYLRGARATSQIDGFKKSSSSLKSIPVDRIVFDEVDEMQPSMIDLAKQRLAHSKVKEEMYVSTPSIPDFGVDKLYQQSDQRVWEVKCTHCGRYTCLELEFPDCITEDGKRLCKKCRREIDYRNGRWTAQNPGAPVVGWWISQLCSPSVDPAIILEEYTNPPNGNIQEVMNSRLGMAYVAATDRITLHDVYKRCGYLPMESASKQDTAMGVDVGSGLHYVIGVRSSEKGYRVIRVGVVKEFNDLYVLCNSYNVKSVVFDLFPETRKVREAISFLNKQSISAYGCKYAQMQVAEAVWDDVNRAVSVGRTELMDLVHLVMTSDDRIILPRKCAEIEAYARSLTMAAKVREETKSGGTVRYVYKKIGPDHYYHATGYFLLACMRLPTYTSAVFDDFIRVSYKGAMAYGIL